MKRALAVLLLGVCVPMGSGCGSDPAPVAPTPVTPQCQTDHTGTISFVNHGSKTVDILWNNAVLATLAPGQTSGQFTVVAGGAQYVFDSVITNTSIHPCQTLLATPLQCQNNPFGTCTF